MAEKTFKEWLDAHHTGIANAIRTKEGSIEKIEPQDFEQRILALPTGGNTPGVTVSDDYISVDTTGRYTTVDILNPQQGDSIRIDGGVMPSIWLDNVTGGQIKLESSEDIAINMENITDDNRITIVNYPESLKSVIKQGVTVYGIPGTYTATSNGEEINVQSKTVKLESIGQTFSPDEGYDYLTSVTINEVSPNIDPYIKKENIRKGVTVLGVSGEYEDPLTETTLNIIPTTISQIINPSDDYDYIKVKNIVVQPVTASIDAEIIASNIKRGVNILGVDGEFDGIPIEFANGTPIDPSDTITTIYFNQNISISGMNNIFSQLDYIDNIYRVAESEDMSSHIWIVRTSSGDSYNYEIQLLDNTVNGIVGETYTFNEFQSVSSLTIISQTIPVGQQNDLLETIISTTPFTIEGIKQELETIEVTASKNTDITVSAATQGYDSDKYTLSKVVVRQVTANVDSNIQDYNILNGVTILGVTGTLKPSVGGVTATTSDITVDFDTAKLYSINLENGVEPNIWINDTILRPYVNVYSQNGGTFDFSGATGTITLVGDSSNTDVNFVFNGINGGGNTPGVTVDGSSITIDNSYDTYTLEFDTGATYNIGSQSGTFNMTMNGGNLDFSQARGTITIKCNNSNTLTISYNDSGLNDIKLNGTSIL